MKHLVCSLLVSLLLGPLVWSQTRAIQPVRIEATTAQEESISYIYEESHALVIGVSSYTNGWSKLAGVKEDVIEVQRALQENGFEVQLLEDPDKQQLEATIEDFIFKKGSKSRKSTADLLCGTWTHQDTGLRWRDGLFGSL